MHFAVCHGSQDNDLGGKCVADKKVEVLSAVHGQKRNEAQIGNQHQAPRRKIMPDFFKAAGRDEHEGRQPVADKCMGNIKIAVHVAGVLQQPPEVGGTLEWLDILK